MVAATQKNDNIDKNLLGSASRAQAPSVPHQTIPGSSMIAEAPLHTSAAFAERDWNPVDLLSLCKDEVHELIFENSSKGVSFFLGGPVVPSNHALFVLRKSSYTRHSHYEHCGFVDSCRIQGDVEKYKADQSECTVPESHKCLSLFNTHSQVRFIEIVTEDLISCVGYRPKVFVVEGSVWGDVDRSGCEVYSPPTPLHSQPPPQVRAQVDLRR